MATKTKKKIDVSDSKSLVGSIILYKARVHVFFDYSKECVLTEPNLFYHFSYAYDPMITYENAVFTVMSLGCTATESDDAGNMFEVLTPNGLGVCSFSNREHYYAQKRSFKVITFSALTAREQK